MAIWKLQLNTGISDNSIVPKKLGIGSAKAEDDQHLEFTTLEMAMQKNGDHGKKISYLKLDIEQSEVEVLRELIDSEIFLYSRNKIRKTLNEHLALRFSKFDRS